jgi:hypothetical protein
MTVTGKIQKFRMREIAIEELGCATPPPQRRPDRSEPMQPAPRQYHHRGPGEKEQ